MNNVHPRLRWMIILFITFFLSGCAHVISRDLRTQADPSLTFPQVSENPEVYRGKVVIWGGETIEVINQKDGTSLLEILQRPLNRWGEPKITSPSEGRFMVLSEKYLDPYIFRRGRKVTVGGEIQGKRVKTIGEMEYHYPLIQSKQIYLWEEYIPVYYYPYPYYDLWWWYPWGWRWGIGFHYYYHRSH